VVTGAAEIALALGSAERVGREYRASCPVHGGRALYLTDRYGTLLWHCFGGCGGREVGNALRELGLIESRGDRFDPWRQEALRQREAAVLKAEIERLRRRIERARSLYRHGGPAEGTPAEAYWRSRALPIPMPPVLRYLPHCPHRNGHYYPAMVAPIVDLHGRQTALHVTFLKRDGSAKADLPKEQQCETIGPMKGGSVRLAQPRPGAPLLVGEGLENAASAMRIFALPAWSTLSAPGLAALELPDEVRAVAIAADHDENRVGYTAALAACARWQAEGRNVEINMPPTVGDDFNDVLQGERP
jgi:putative DNA primase/helicase